MPQRQIVIGLGSPPANMSPAIDKICDQFEAALLANSNTTASAYLHLLPKEQRAELLNHLLQVELEHAIESGRRPLEREYHQEYPEFPQSVAKAFKEMRRRISQGLQPNTVENRIPPEVNSLPLELEANMISESLASASQCTVTLKVTHGPTAGRELTFVDHQTCIVGRSKDAHLRLSPNPEFSRFHCRLEVCPPQIVIIDLGSTNGTKVNGKRIDTAALYNGDMVTVGDVKFNVVVQNPESPALAATIIPMNSAYSDDGMDSFDEHPPEIPGYVLDRKLGNGSMGTVYFARRVATNACVAIKVVRPLVATDQKAIDRFQREASIILRLQHKRIVKCLDFRLSDDHLPYLVMEYVNEVKPSEVLSGVPVAERCRMVAGIMVRVLEGLQYAHDLEIVHRDLKPANMLFYRAGRKLQVKLADFGLAKNFVDAGFSNFSTSNEFCGTLAYMPSEQIVDCRYAKPSCDIYAAGVCLYKLISDRLPFDAEQVAQQISLILNHSPIPISTWVPQIPPQLVAIIERALSKDADDRFRSAEEMRQALLPLSKRQ